MQGLYRAFGQLGGLLMLGSPAERRGNGVFFVGRRAHGR
jgi:hypothetical protein